MINKPKLIELIQDNLQYSNLLEYKIGGEPFFIIDSCNIIEKLMRLQGLDDSENRVCYRCKHTIHTCTCDESQSPYYEKKDTLDLEKLLGLSESDWIYPLDESDINTIQNMLYTHDLVMGGQLILDELMNPIKSIDEWLQSNHVSFEVLCQIQDYIKQNPEYILDDLNDWIKDQISDIEYGFNDEYTICDECGMNSFRTQPDSYGWTKSYLDTDNGYICSECAINQGYLEDFISECQDRLLRGESPKSYPDNIQSLNMDEWHTIIHPLSYGQWENGLHYGQKDNPTKQGIYLKSLKLGGFINPMFDVVFIIYPEQFTTAWDINIRLNPEFLDEYKDRKNRDFMVNWNDPYNWDRLLIRLGELLYLHTQDKYSPGELYGAALKQHTGKKFNTIRVNTDTGEINIQSTDDFDEYLNQSKSL